MPELPEVKTIVEELNRRIKGRKIGSIKISDPSFLRNRNSEEFKTEVEGEKITEAKRKGKYIILDLTGEYLLAVHLRMTGKFLFNETSDHERLAFDLDGEKLRIDDVRKFGTLDLITDLDSPPLRKLGIDPLSEDYNWENFEALFDTRREVKRLLLDQKKLTGLGNIYANEALFRAKICPWKETNKIPPEKKRGLFKSVRETLKEAIRNNGTTINDYRTVGGEEGEFQNMLRVYGREKEECLNCGESICKEKQSGRSTYFCPSCQSNRTQ